MLNLFHFIFARHQHPLEDLADGRLGDGLDEDVVTRALEVGEFGGLAVGIEFVRRNVAGDAIRRR